MKKASILQTPNLCQSITKTEGLDFDPAPFCKTGRTYTETGAYTEYPKGSKPYADF